MKLDPLVLCCSVLGGVGLLFWNKTALICALIGLLALLVSAMTELRLMRDSKEELGDEE